MKYIKNKGITLLEILIVLAIGILLAAIVLPSLTRFRAEQILNNTTQDVVALLNSARNNTLTSYNSNNYSVHFETGRVVYFTGSSFNTNDSTNNVLTFDSQVSIAASGGINLNGSGSDVIFTRLTGDTTDYGTIIIRLTSNTTHTRTITISKTGSVSSN